MDEMHARLSRCFLAVFPDLTEREVADASPSSVTSWDSVATLNLLTVIEEEFNLEIDFVDIMKSLSFSEIGGYLERRIATRVVSD
jgi:acyl carrier protein